MKEKSKEYSESITHRWMKHWSFVPVVLFLVIAFSCWHVANPVLGASTQHTWLKASTNQMIFGNVTVGSTASQTVTLTSHGNGSVTITQINVPSGFSVTGLTTPMTLTANQSTALTVTCAPMAAGKHSGVVSVISTAANSPNEIYVAVTGVLGTAQLAANPGSVGFGNVTVGSTSSQTVTLTNSGTSSVTISQLNTSGTGFSTSGMTTPVTLAAGQSTGLTATFTAPSVGSFSGSVSVVSSASNSPTITLTGAGVSGTGQITASPGSVSFGNITVGSSSSQTVTLTNSGTSTVTISQVNTSGSGFSDSGMTTPVTVGPGKSTTLTATFTAPSGGSFSGSISVVSSASGSPTTVNLSGTGVHAVDLSWTGSSGIAGYNVYRGTQSGGPFTKVNSSLISATDYVDSTVQGGQTYYYVTTSVNSNNVESGYSNEVSVVVPSP